MLIASTTGATNIGDEHYSETGVFDVPAELAEHLLAFPGWQHPSQQQAEDWVPPADPEDDSDPDEDDAEADTGGGEADSDAGGESEEDDSQEADTEDDTTTTTTTDPPSTTRRTRVRKATEPAE